MLGTTRLYSPRTIERKIYPSSAVLSNGIPSMPRPRLCYTGPSKGPKPDIAIDIMGDELGTPRQARRRGRCAATIQGQDPLLPPRHGILEGYAAASGSNAHLLKLTHVI